MFENVINFFKNVGKGEKETGKSKNAAKERLHLVLMQDRANVSADFLDLMKQEIIEVIKKYICVDENAIDVRLTNKSNVDGTNGAPALYANIPIVSIKEEVRVGMARQKEEDMVNVLEDNEIEEAKNVVETVKENGKKTIKTAGTTKKVTAQKELKKENEAKIEAKTTKNTAKKKELVTQTAKSTTKDTKENKK